MKRIVFPEPGRILLEESGTPALGKTAVLLESDYSLISNGTEHTVLHRLFDRGTHWDQWVRYPFAPGYATVGRVLDAGSAVSLVKRGERVAVRAPHASHHVVLEDACASIPDGVDSEQAVWFALARIGFLGVWVSELKLGSSILVLGGGPVAQMLVRWVASGLPAAVAIMAGGSVQLELAKRGGATVALQGHTADYSLQQIENSIGRRPDIIFDCTADPDVLAWALGIVADYGRVILVGDPGTPNARRLTADILLRSIAVVGVHDRNRFARWTGHSISRLFFGQLSAGRFNVSGLCTHVFAPEDASLAYGLLSERAAKGVLGIRFDWRDLRGLGR